MRYQQLIESHDIDTIELDSTLVDLCRMVVDGQKQGTGEHGMVGACCIGPAGKTSSTTMRHDGKWSHAEREAVDAYESQYGSIADCTVVTTLSPCTNAMPDREGLSCQDFLDSKGITKIYCG